MAIGHHRCLWQSSHQPSSPDLASNPQSSHQPSSLTPAPSPTNLLPIIVNSDHLTVHSISHLSSPYISRSEPLPQGHPYDFNFPTPRNLLPDFNASMTNFAFYSNDISKNSFITSMKAFASYSPLGYKNINNISVNSYSTPHNLSERTPIKLRERKPVNYNDDENGSPE